MTSTGPFFLDSGFTKFVRYSANDPYPLCISYPGTLPLPADRYGKIGEQNTHFLANCCLGEKVDTAREHFMCVSPAWFLIA
jgi:hypothetical protein